MQSTSEDIDFADEECQQATDNFEEQKNANPETNSGDKYAVDENQEVKGNDNICEAAIDKHRANVDIEQAKIEVQKAEEAWNKLDNIPKPVSSNTSSSEVTSMSDVTLNEALKFYSEKDLEEYQNAIKPLQSHKGIRGVIQRISTIFKKQKLDSSLHSARDFIFKVALCPFEDESPICSSILKTVYKKVIGSGVDCPRYGNHWEQIGFQGYDPATDFRGCGMLGLLHILNLCEDSNLSLCKKIYTLSRNQTQNFPFSLMSINITSIILQAMRDQIFNKELNDRHKGDAEEEKLVNFFHSVCEFHLAVFYHLYKTWKNEGKTMANSGYVLEDVKKHTRKFSQQMIKNLEQNPSG